ncbi:MAG TPA: FtsQ-type POTRA domain-containing protein [Smithellaceae bacterium]|nr:FtsQ-type POTRA domain-containing protein [Smithellaceae bacterium]HRV43842.1 FtsQ-type POTRA domain-containing protein [Smithellaceae bacterium]
MSPKIKVSLEARKNRLRRRLIGALNESLGALALLALAAVASALLVYLYSVLLSAPGLELKEISVRGVKELTEKDILELAKIQPRCNLLAVNTDAVARRIAVNPWVKRIYVGRELPGRLVLDVRERTPIALVKQTGNFYLMDAEGVVFKKLSRTDDVDLAILTGVNLGKTPSPLLAEALKLLGTLSGDSYASLGTISEIHIDEVFGLSVLTDRGLHLKLGRDHFTDKVRRLDVVLADLEKRGMKNGRLFVDLADISKVTVQRKDEPGKAQEQKKGPQYRI